MVVSTVNMDGALIDFYVGKHCFNLKIHQLKIRMIVFIFSEKHWLFVDQVVKCPVYTIQKY